MHGGRYPVEETVSFGREFAGTKGNPIRFRAAEGEVRLFGRTAVTEEETLGIVIFQAESEEKARALMEGDPAVAEQVLAATLYPFRLVHP